jgi:hypothetical protein
MMIVLAQFGLMSINLMLARMKELKGGNPAFSYFVAGILCGFGIEALFKLLL